MKKMKKIIIVLLLFISFYSAFAQDDDTIVRFRIVAAGSSYLENGENVIKLDEKCDEYSVILTSINEFSNLYIKEKNNRNFIVKSDDDLNAKFDYIVIEKQTKIKLVHDDIKEGYKK